MRYSTVRSTITRAARTVAGGSMESVVAVGQFGTVLRWLAADD
ncbi:hypothetical protein [Nocardia colli]|nr:hypothetical protein [Nocardia colli]